MIVDLAPPPHSDQEHECKLTKDIVELIDREADLLMRGVKETNLEGLRKRISTLVLQYIKTPTFNPEVAKILKVSDCWRWADLGLQHPVVYLTLWLPQTKMALKM